MSVAPPFPATLYRERLHRFRRWMKTHRLDAGGVSDPTNIRYLTGFRAEESWLLVSRRTAWFLTDARLFQEAADGVCGARVVNCRQGVLAGLVQKCAGLGSRVRVGLDSRHVSVHVFRHLQRLSGRGVSWILADGGVESLRQIKEDVELQKMRQALGVHHQLLRYLQRWLQPGRSEWEVFQRCEAFLKRRGLTFSFDPIIASGPHSACPHARISHRRFQRHDVILVDMGVDVDGYKSDLTRIFFLGRIPPQVQRVYQAVNDARQAAVDAVREGAAAEDIDQAARNLLRSKGLSRYFSHATGHGVGLDIHEAPRLAKGQTARLKEGMVITIEPGVYFSGQYGIRLEDMVRVTSSGSENLSQAIPL